MTADSVMELFSIDCPKKKLYKMKTTTEILDHPLHDAVASQQSGCSVVMQTASGDPSSK